VGTVSLTGLVVPVEMTPNAITGRYRSKGARLAHPAYTLGARWGLHASNAAIECDFPDNRAAEIPAVLVAALLAQGRSGYPTIELTRRTATSTGMALGCVQLLVTSSASAGVSVSVWFPARHVDNVPPARHARPLERSFE
jgi:hypothetical protein